MIKLYCLTGSLFIDDLLCEYPCARCHETACLCRKVKLWSPLRASWRLGHELDHETIRRKASNLKKQARNSRIRKGIAPKHLYFYHGICVSYRWQFWWSSSFLLPEDFPDAPKCLMGRNITASGSTLSVCMYPLKRWTCQVQVPTCGTHAICDLLQAAC